MPVYVIAYDLHREPAAVYCRLTDALMDARAWHAQESLWLLNSPYSARENFEWFTQFIYQNDELIVCEMLMSNTWLTKQSKAYACLQWMAVLGPQQRILP